MDEKKMVYIILGLLVFGCLAVLFVVIFWFMGRGVSDWKQVLINDGLILAFFIIFGYGVYIGTRTHKK
tara:strand:- start:781 stop:984 length:204 start_codon:yes stop_codon:yes gene_type:complete